MEASESPRMKWITAFFFAVILLVLLVKLKTPFNFYDEALVVLSAARVSQGEIPYRDFWGIYPPAQFYMIAGLFKLFGEALLPARLLDTVFRFLTVLAVFLIVRKITSRRWAFFTAGLIGLMLATIGFYAYPIFTAVGMCLWAVWCWANYTHTGQKKWLVATGVLLGITSLTRWDVFLYAGISIGIAAVLFQWAGGGPGPALGKPGWARGLFASLKPLAWLLLPMALIPLIGYALLGVFSGWRNLFEQVFYFPAFKLHDVRWLAYPALLPADFPPSDDWKRFYLPILILALAGLYALVTFLRKRGRLDPAFYVLVAMIFFGAFLFNQGLSRYDYIHVLPSSILTLMVGAAVSHRVLPRMGRPSKAALFVLIAVATWVYFRPAVDEMRLTLRLFPPWGCYSTLEKASCVWLDPNQEQAVRYLQSVTRPDQAVFTGIHRHDKVFVNDVGLYFLADRTVATRYQELHPGSANTEPVQAEIVSELETQQVPWIILTEIWESTEPNGSAVSTGVVTLDTYLAAHYALVDTFGSYRLYKRR